MTLRQKQTSFWLNVAKLIVYAQALGTQLFVNEWIRSAATQAANVAKGASATMNSMHLYGLAVDLLQLKDVMDDGMINMTFDDYKALGEYWESLDPNNIWGGRFGTGGNKNKKGWDSCHFEYRG